MALKMQYPLLKSQSEEDSMPQYLELVMKRDLVPGWRHAFEKVRVLFAKKSEVDPEPDPEEKAEQTDWRDSAGKDWYY